MSERLKLYVDLDGVLADFDAAYSKIVGTSDKTMWPPDDESGSFWKLILDTPYFWLDIPLMAEADRLWRLIRQHHYVTILSSPGSHDMARALEQKRFWVRRYLGNDVNVIFKAAKKKHHYACPNSVLIDDWPRNIERWKEAGGIGILHRSASETMEQLFDLRIGVQ